MDNADVAAAFSSHRFAEVADRLAPDVVWFVPGSARLDGRDAVIAACQATSDGNAHVTTTWLRFVATADGPVVAVDAIGRYAGPDGVVAVSSCDIYEFDGAMLRTITSYMVEVDPDDSPAAPTTPAPAHSAG